MTPFGNLAIVDASRDVEECNGDCSAWSKAENQQNIVAMCPSIEVTIWDIFKRSLLQM